MLVADDEPQLLRLMPRLARSLVRISGDVLDDPLQDLMHDHDGVHLRRAFPPAADLQALEDSLVKGDA